MSGHHLVLAHSGQAACFREAFTHAGYKEEGLVGTLGLIRLPNHLGSERGHFRRLTGGGRPLDTLIRLFLLGLPEDVEAARRALEPLPLQDWICAGLVQVEGGEVRGLVRIMAYRHLLLACDQLELGEPRSDMVMGITASTTILADFTIRRHSRATFDLGAGTGVQAFLAAEHSDRVFAVDRSPRAVEFARFNAAFNARGENIEFIEGDGFEPVAGRKFDLVISNPPFAITPSVRYTYRDSGVAGDGFARSLIATAARSLNEGGLCQIVCDWAHIAGEDWKERLSGWFTGTECDAWVMRTETQQAADYAHVWIRDTEHSGPEESERRYDEWLAFYKQAGIEAIGTGLIALRKASGRANWVRIEDAPATNSGPFGDVVLRGFGLRDFLEAHQSDEALLGAKFRVSESTRLDHVCVWEDSAWRIQSAKIRLADGLQWEGNIDLRLAGMVALCDGRHTLREVLTAMAAKLGTGLDRLAPQCIALARQLIERGFLLPPVAAQ